MMNDDLKKIKRELEKKLKLLEKESERISQADPYEDVDRINDNAAIDTDAAEEQEHITVEAIESQLQESVELVKKALERIDEGSWGKCDKCGKDIEAVRLEIDPTSMLCSRCAKKR